jgi:hypothetical protein
VDPLSLAFGIAGIVGAGVSTLVAVVPMAREWWYDRKNEPLRVRVIREFTRVNPTYGGRIRIRIDNRIRSAVPIQYSPLTECETITDESGRVVESRGKLFDNPTVRRHPMDRGDALEPVPGHDSRELELLFPVRAGVLEGKEVVSPVIWGNRFKPQEIRLGPFHFEVSPSFT